jgi:hypothetical protein
MAAPALAIKGDRRNKSPEIYPAARAAAARERRTLARPIPAKRADARHVRRARYELTWSDILGRRARAGMPLISTGPDYCSARRRRAS